jgi:2'-5' RNA ligase
MPAPEATALVIVVPESEPLVRGFREMHDPVAAAGMPAHITLLYPFKHPDEVGDSLAEELSLIFALHRSFRFFLVGIDRFPGVLYLAPEPAAPFQDLTRAIGERYPDTPPYGGAYPEVVPHLTVAYAAGAEELCAIEEELRRAAAAVLPIEARAHEIWLVEKRDGLWHRHTSFPLGSY